MRASIETKGLKELKQKAGDRRTIGDPLRAALKKAAQLVERRARKLAKGSLKGTISHAVDISTIPEWAKVSSSARIAPWVEFGHKQQVGQFVPGIEKRLVAERVKGRFFLWGAFKDMRRQINSVMNKFNREFDKKFDRKV